MRITSSMMTNNMMMNVNRNMRNLDTLWQQFSTGSRIQVPSDNPLIAARAMKFRNNMVANENFQNNVEHALAWMDVTEASMDNMLQVLMLEIRDTIHRASNDYLGLDGRQTLATSLRNMKAQMKIDMNTQFAGRYIFSGLRTDQPPLFTQDQPDLEVRITQSFNLSDIERIRSLQIFPPVPGNNINMPITHDVPILKLAYRGEGVDIPTLTASMAANGFALAVRSSLDPSVDAYEMPAPGHVVFIRETGELIFNITDVTGANATTNFPMDITYEVRGFREGELNPLVYFDSVLLDAPADHSFHHLLSQPEASRTFNMNNQNLIYEFSTHTTIPVNTLAKNVLTDKLFADLQRLIDFIEGIRETDPAIIRAAYEAPPSNLSGAALDEAVARHSSDETLLINNAINQRLNSMLFLIDRHSTAIRREYTDIGSRGRRLELFQNRLEQDEGSLYRLMSHNEDSDLARLATLMSSAEAAYMASIRVGNSIINVTLANFLQV